jgi:TrpR-related protein YerC/YecD
MAKEGRMSSMTLREVENLPGLDDLADAFLTLRNRDEVKRFLRDLCTLTELEALSHRWQIARMLEEKKPYLEIAETIHTSTATVTRVAQWLRHGTGGYRLALDRTARRKAKAAKA